MPDSWEAVLDLVRGAGAVLLVLHVRPDGDSLGSSLAMARCLGAMGKAVHVTCADPLPANLAFLDPTGICQPPDRLEGPFDVALFLDCADLERCGAARSLVSQAKTLVNVDHHPSNRRFGDVNYIEARAAACGEIVFALLSELGATIDSGVATALYTALVTDTGSFRFANTTSHTLCLAARLVELGADADQVGREVWSSRSLASLRLLEAALHTLALDAGGRIAWMSVTPAMLRQAGASAEDGEGLVDYPRALRGVEVALLFSLETAGYVRVNLRSGHLVDASLLAGAFGGGGHARAAGCTVRGSLRAVRERVLAATRTALSVAGMSAAGQCPDPAVLPTGVSTPGSGSLPPAQPVNGRIAP